MVSVFHQEIKTIEFIQCLINFAETSQGRANCVRKLCLHSDVLERPRMSILNMMQNTLLVHYFRSFSPNLLREIFKSLMLFVLTAQKKQPADVLKTFRRDLLRVTSLRRPQGVNSEPSIQMHFHCSIFNFILPNVCLKHQRVSCFIVLRFWTNIPKTSYKSPKVTSGG